MSVDELQSSLMVHEQKFQQTDNGNVDQVLKVKGQSGTVNRGRASSRGMRHGQGRSTFNKETVECFKCHELGHFQYEYPKLNQNTKKEAKEANYIEIDEDELLLMA